MDFEIMPCEEFENYLNDKISVGKLKGLLRKSDLSHYTLSDVEKLSTLFDKNGRLTSKLLDKQLELYFALIKDKNTSGIRIPIFHNYVESLYYQDLNSLDDDVFKIMVSKLLKLQIEKPSDALNVFMLRLPKQFDRKLDNISNTRLGILISILQSMDLPYNDMPEECQKFVRNLFAACAVKTEIADNNRTRFCGIFKDNPQYYYSLFNKAFAGVGQYDVWIDEPAKKITLDNMVRYANYQGEYLKQDNDSVYFRDFERAASNYMFNHYDKNGGYLKEEREYKNYAVRAKNLFVDMLKSELCQFAKSMKNGDADYSVFESLALTKKMDGQMKYYENRESVGMFRAFADFLIDLVHLDSLTGKPKGELISTAEILSAYNDDEQKNTETKSQTPMNQSIEKTAKPESEILNEMEDVKDLEYERFLYDFDEINIFEKMRMNACTIDDLPELYELAEKDPDNWEINLVIHDLELQEKESREDNELAENYGKENL